jgi:hypothetical protein
MSQHIRVHASLAYKCNERLFHSMGVNCITRISSLSMSKKKLFHNLAEILDLFFNNYKFESFQSH